MPEDNTFNQTDDAVETTTNSEIPISDDYGVFLVGETGQVTLNYLYDGGAYKGEVAFFSLRDMKELEPGSPEFIQEAARRSLSNSEDGHVVIKDPSEGAQFTEELIGDYHNTDAESYPGPKEFSMRPGDEFAVMLVPNSTVESLLDNPELDGENRPLFSLATANPEDGLQIGQIADLSGEGSAFAMEDLRVDNGSDKDYNDVIFQIRGAIGTAIHVDEMIATQNDWRDTEEGEKLQGEIEEFLAPSVVESDESEAEEESAEETLEDTAEETEEDTAEEPIADSEDIEGTEAEDDLAGSEDSDTIPETVGPFDSGFFVVGNSGEVNFNFLYDGGGFSNGEVALFDIEGMEELEPGSEEFIKEAARRSLTGSELGHVVIRDAEEGAQISEGIGDAFNEGEYQGVKSVSMTPGSTFAVMLVPNGKVQDLFDNPGASGAKRPLFSLSTANPNEFFHVGQVADLTGHGSAFVMEDLRVDSSEGSDKDYNDIIFQVTGATGSAISLDELVEEQSLDAVRAWRESEEGQEFLVEVEQVIAESIAAQEDIEGSEGDDDVEDSDDDVEDSDDDVEDSDDDVEDSDDDVEDSDDDVEDSDDDVEGSEGDDDIEGSEGDDDIEGSEGEDTLPENVGPFESGFFIVDESGEVSLDYLYDGGAYKGEVAIFSIEGMEDLEPGSEEFIQEAARRSLTGSQLGHVVIRDRIEGAQMTEPLGDYFNYDADSYQGEKNFAMNPGDAFGVMLVPAGTVQEAFDRPGSLGAKRPLFSLATANPEDGMQMGQVSDMTGDGTVFAMEDLRVDLGSDRDYNDVMFRVSGAKGRALHLDEAIAPEKDWRTSEAGEAFLADMEAAIAESDDDADMPLILEPIPDSSEDDPEEDPGEEAVEESEDGEVSDIEDTDSEDIGEGETEEDPPEASVPGEQIDGDEGDNAIAGTEGDDDIRGMDGEDAIEGAEGDDHLNGNVGEDTVAGGAGDDVVHGGQNDDVIFGEDGADEVYGDLGNDTGLGGEGNDTVLGGEGVDNINGNQGTDEINGNQGDDTVYGGQGDDIVRGGKDNDMLYGDLGNDVLYGDLGNDTLTGGPGEDVLIGGEGADTFALAADSGTDAIVDFVLGEDTLGLSGGLTFDDLTITQGSASTDPTLIQVTETEAVLASLTGVQESDLTPEAFSLI